MRQVAVFLNNATLAAEKFTISLRALEQQSAQVGINAGRLVESLRMVTRGQVSLADLTTAANRAIALLGKDAIPRFEELADVALKASQVMGISVTQAFNDIVTGIGRQSRMILDNLGIIVSMDTAYNNFAATLGKTSSQLTENEKKMAFLNAVIDQGKDKFADLDVTLSARDGLSASFADLKREIGEALLPQMEALAGISTDVVDGLRLMVKEVKEVQSGLNLLTLEFKDVNDEVLGYNASTREFVFSTLKRAVAVRAFGDELELMRRQRQMVLGGGAGAFGVSQIPTPFFPEDLQDQVKNVEAAFQAALKILNPNADAIKNLNNRARELRNTLKELADPAVKAVLGEIRELEKQVSGILNPSIDKSADKIDRLSKSMGLYFDNIIRIEQAEKRATQTRLKAIEIFGVAAGGFEKAFQNVDVSGIGRKFGVPGRGSEKGTLQTIKEQLGLVDPELDITSMSLQFGQAISNAFRSSSVTDAVAQTLSAGVNFAVQAGAMASATGDPIIAGIALVAGLVDLFSGGSKPAPVITKPVDVRIVEITGNAATKLLGVSQRQLIASSALFNRGADSREQLRQLS